MSCDGLVACAGCVPRSEEACFSPLTGGTGSSTLTDNSTGLSGMTRCSINIERNAKNISGKHI